MKEITSFPFSLVLMFELPTLTFVKGRKAGDRVGRTGGGAGRGD